MAVGPVWGVGIAESISPRDWGQTPAGPIPLLKHRALQKSLVRSNKLMLCALEEYVCVSPSADPIENPHYTIDQLSKRWGLSRRIITALFEREPGVLVIGPDQSGTIKTRRKYRTIRIPTDVAERVYQRLVNPTPVPRLFPKPVDGQQPKARNASLLFGSKYARVKH